MNALFATSIYWDFPVLLVTFSLVYAATRHDRWDRILWEAAGWAVRIGGFLLGVGVTLFVLSTYLNRWPYLIAVGVVFGLGYLAVNRPWVKAKPSSSPPG
ncbi:MAG: hypothetical protein U0871_16565 [Gemmataceae bacterium]